MSSQRRRRGQQEHARAEEVVRPGDAKICRLFDEEPLQFLRRRQRELSPQQRGGPGDVRRSRRRAGEGIGS